VTARAHLPPGFAPLRPPETTLDATLDEALRAIEAAGLLRATREVRRLGGGRLLIDDREALDFASNDYLGLAADPRLASAMAAAAASAGAGAGAARLITGTHPIHTALERELAQFAGADAALLFASGFAANIAVIPALVDEGDVIYSDECAHASLIDGCRLSRARTCIVPHGDLEALENRLQANAGQVRRSLIVMEGVYSMEGDRVALDRLLPLARRFGAWVMLDDAHAFGLVGSQGRGSAAIAWPVGAPDIIVGTLGKSFGTSGAFVAGSCTLIEYLRHRARPFIYSTALAPPIAAATRVALRIARDEEWRRERVKESARIVRARLRAMGREALGHEESAIVPIPIGDPQRTMRVAARLEREGFIVGAIRPPTVPEGTSRLRVTLSAAHEPADLERFCDALEAALRTGGE
jgi:8-amino-7-oxononanoate synthase